MLTFNLSDHLLQHFDKRSAMPRNQQLYGLLRKAILDRVLRAHTRLPSTRHLAAELDVSRNTVMFAYEQLLAEGFLAGRTGSGTFVTDTRLPENVEGGQLRA